VSSRGARAPFSNLDGSGPQPFRNVLRWAVVDQVLGRRRRTPSRADVPRVAADVERLRRPPAAGEPARLTWIGHASWLVQLDGVSLLLDPVLGPRIFPFIGRNVPAALSAAELPRIDATLVTHNHYDHLDAPSVRAVGAPVLAGLGTRRHLPRLAVSELGWWESHRVGEVEVVFVPAQHWSRRRANDINRTLWGGFVIRGRQASVYHSGDTAYFEGFAEIGRRYPGMGAAMLPIGAYDPGWFMERQHMNPEQAAQAFVDLGARRFLAMHWGTFKLTDEPLLEPPARLRAEWARRGLPPGACGIPAVGETVEVGP
jgi:L-ascorbate metabolism protein UlaG (beta-lactamase superfamily)